MGTEEPDPESAMVEREEAVEDDEVHTQEEQKRLRAEGQIEVRKGVWLSRAPKPPNRPPTDAEREGRVQSHPLPALPVDGQVREGGRAKSPRLGSSPSTWEATHGPVASMQEVTRALGEGIPMTSHKHMKHRTLYLSECHECGNTASGWIGSKKTYGGKFYCGNCWVKWGVPLSSLLEPGWESGGAASSSRGGRSPPSKGLVNHYHLFQRPHL